MTSICDFKKVRCDGKVIDETMTAKEMIALGWRPEKVVETTWSFNAHPVSVKTKFGLLAKVVSGREYVAVIEEIDETGRVCELVILNPDGSRRKIVEKIQNIHNTQSLGEFCWFEQPRLDKDHVFGVVFERQPDKAMFHLDIDASNGVTIGTYPLRG